jgi:hypothetical protein
MARCVADPDAPRAVTDYARCRLPKGLKPLKKDNEPKRARSGYFLWCDSVRAASKETPDPEIDGKSMAVASKVLAARWKLLSKEEKLPFEDRAAAGKAAFETKRKRGPPTDPRAMLPSGWRAGRDVITGAVFYTCVATKKSQWSKPTDADAVAMPPAPPSARRLYEMAGAPAGAWAELDADARAPYEAQAREARVAYKKAISGLRT